MLSQEAENAPIQCFDWQPLPSDIHFQISSTLKLDETCFF
jgi:hypothetical protein